LRCKIWSFWIFFRENGFSEIAWGCFIFSPLECYDFKKYWRQKIAENLSDLGSKKSDLCTKKNNKNIGFQ
jgi:hypothetical protein